LVTLQYKNAPIEQILNAIETQTSYHFLFNKQDVDVTQNVTIAVSKQSINSVLAKIFKGADVVYRIEGKQIILSKTKIQPEQNKIRNTSIRGTVKDEKGIPLIGASVMVKNTKTGTVTDIDGHFSLDADDGVLLISYIGYETRDIEIGNKTEINVVLSEDSKKLNEVVVVGYGTQRKVNLTGAIASTSGDALQKYSSPNSTANLQGLLPGLQITQGSGQPGAENVQLLVRGMGSYGSSNTPLIIVDGIPASMPTSDNIESVTVLKDAASAAIYGSRAANGVILVSTKRGKASATHLEYDICTGLYQATKIPNVISNSADFMTLWNQAAIHSNSPGEQYAQSDIDKYRNANGDPRYPNTNWMKLIFRNAYVTTHSLTFTGGNDKTTYNLNFNYLSQPGVMIGSDFHRYTSRLNVDSKISNLIKAGVNVSLSYSDTRGTSGDVFTMAFTQSPTYGPYLLDGSGKLTKNAFPAIEYKNNRNPFVLLDGSNTSNIGINCQLNPYLRLTFTDWLSLDINGSCSASYSKYKSFASAMNTYNWITGAFAETTSPDYTGGNSGGLIVSDNNSINPLFYSTLNFNKKFGNHYVSALAGTQVEYSKSESLSAYRSSYTTNLTQEIDAGALTNIQNGGNASELAMLSYFGRLNYSFKDKYLCELNLRADGSSRFAEGHRWGYFPSASVGWRPFQEVFIPKIKFLDDAKIRGSYGVLGNQGTSNYPYENVMAANGLYSFDNSTVQSGIAPSALVNRNISWEVTKILDLGVDLTLLNNKLALTVDWFKKNTSGILRSQQVTYETGYSSASPYVNSGAMQNIGYEISAEYRGNINKLKYAVNWNFQTYKNKVTSFGSDEINSSPYGPTITKEGAPYGSYYLYEWDGIFQSQAEADASGQANKPKAGDLKIKDLNGDGKIDGNDKTIVSGRFPKFSSGLKLTASYNNFDFSAFFYGSFGQKVYVYGPGFEPFYQGSVPTKDWLNAWTPENHSTTMPAVYNAQKYNSTWTMYPNTWFLQDNSFVRLKNLNLGWTIKSGVISKLKLKSMRIYLAGDNLCTITKYKGLDPERNGGGNYLTYPQNRVYSIGANLQF
jgi:TonB-linked outer membrane protein, SusC/RagA family